MMAKGARPRRLLRAVNKGKRLDAREQAEMKRLGAKNRHDLLWKMADASFMRRLIGIGGTMVSYHSGDQ